MSDDDFDRVFGSRSPGVNGFAERIGRSEPDPIAFPLAPQSGCLRDEAVYRPYGFLPTASVVETCDVQSWIDGTQIAEGIEFQYRFLLQIAYVGEDQLRLFLPDCIIVIEGKRLHELRKKLGRRQVTFIQQFNDRIWPRSGIHDTQATIHQINIVRASSVP